MVTSSEFTPASSSAIGAGAQGSGFAVHECDFCGRAVYRATAVEHVQRGGDEPEVITLCAQCAFGVD